MSSKQMPRMIIVSLLCSALGASVLFADVTNVALDKPVTLNGIFFTGGWGGGSIVSADTVVDGIFFTRGQQWDLGPVWWDSSGDNTGQSIVIDLEGVYVIESLIIQADDNDAYKLYYWDIGSSDWVLAWDVPNYDTVPDPSNWGMQTRPNPDDDTERYMLVSSIITSALKIEGNMSDTGDSLFSVSEVQAFGSPILEVDKELVDWLDLGDGDGYLEVGELWWFLLEITVTNNGDTAIDGIELKDRLGGDLMLMDIGYTNPYPDTYSTKGKTEKAFLGWDVGTLDPGETATFYVHVATDTNTGTGNGKKAGHQEYTSIGEHELNSGATAKGMLGDLQVSDTSDSITVEVLEPGDYDGD